MTEKNLRLAEIDKAGVRAGQRWRHYKGGVYTVIAVGLVEATLDPMVVYAGHDGIVWVRTLFVWLEEVAESTPRFKRLDEEEEEESVVSDAGYERDVVARQPCALQEGNCKAHNCPEHGFPTDPTVRVRGRKGHV